MSRNYERLTAGGYRLDEVASALQKCIRRGLEREAIYWALEMYSRYPKYVWRRLAVIVVEDIGGANPDLITQTLLIKRECMELYEQYREYSAHFLAHTVIQMCRSPKSREADDAAGEIRRLLRTGRLKPEIPDFALDWHTRRGRQMGRGIEHFWTESARLENEAYPSAYTGYEPGVGDGSTDASGRSVPIWPDDSRKKKAAEKVTEGQQTLFDD